MTNLLGGVSFDVSANVESAIVQVQKLQSAFGKAAENIRNTLAGGRFEFIDVGKDADESLKIISATLGQLDREINQLKATTANVDLAAPFKDVIPNLERIREEVAKGLGPAIGTEKEREALQESLFQLEQRSGEAAAENARAREAQFERQKKNLGELRAVQESLYRLETQGAHDVAVAKEKAYQQATEAAKKAFSEQEQLAARLSRAIESTPEGKSARQQQDFQFNKRAAEASGLTVAQNRLAASSNSVAGAFAKVAERGGFLGKIAGGLGGIFGKAEGALAGLGLSISNVSVLLGAGFAAGIAGVIQIGTKFIEVLGRMAQAVLKFAFNAAIISSQINSLKENLSATFGSASEEVIKFAENATLAFGVSEAKALEFLNSFGQLLQSFGVAKDSAATLSTGLFSVASALRRGHEASVTAAESLQLLKDTISGNLEGLRKLDFIIRDIELNKLAEQLGLAKGPLDNFERSQLSIILLAQEAKRRLLELPTAATTLAEKFEVARNLLERLTREIGDELVPVFSFLADAAIGFALGVLQMVKAFKDSKKAIEDFVERTPILQKALNLLKETVFAMFPGLTLLARLLGKSADAGEEARKFAKVFKDELAALNGVISESRTNLTDYAQGYQLTEEEINSVIDAHERFERAVRDAAQAEADARLGLSRVIEDNAKRAEDARRNLAKAISDAVKNEAEARRNLADVKETQRRKIRDAEERLADKQIDNTKKIDAAERDLAKARQARSDAILKALIAIQDAQFNFDTQSFNQAQRELTAARDTTAVKEAQRKLDETTIEGLLEIARLQRDLDEARLDARKAIEEAERKLAEVILDGMEKIFEAERRLGEVEVENNRNLFDARQRLDRVLESNAEKIQDAVEAEERLLEKFGITLDQVEKLKNGLIATKRILEEMATRWEVQVSQEEPVGRTGHLAHGGSAFQNRHYLVGERGPELFIPNQNGQVISNDVLRKLIAAMNGGRGGGGGNSITVHEAADPEATAFAVEARMMRGIHN